ncbi:MAG: DUF4129 domain-containing protein [Euryarchaeota archaeon]|nr:DUF4129 domain-containing protein [Euryarchaeota archaeon]MDE1837271.1 DUF4129 domain-containing protein [Euryarchaeota archaeon]MDE1879941.1 DUF4129 domain-containing protein [Euryarchaeota archaeon]MDE2045125.1 DUF4129 domain-containing protein [Thermoplasmata archaeon]
MSEGSAVLPSPNSKGALAGLRGIDRGSLAIMFVLLFSLGLGATAGLLGSFQTLPPPTRFGSPYTYEVGFIVFSVLLASLVLGFVYVRVRNRKSGSWFAQGSGVTLLAFLMVVLVIFGLLGLASLSQQHRSWGSLGPGGTGNSTNGTTGPPPPPGGGGTNNGSTRTNSTPGSLLASPYTPTLFALSGGIVLSLIVVPVAAYLVRRGKPRPGAAPPPGRELLTKLEEAVAQLDAGELGEAKRRIVEAYAALLKELEGRGIPDLETSTPREVEGLMGTHLRLDSPSAHALRTLFEEARYSLHPMGEEQAKAAKASLSDVLGQLKAAGPGATTTPSTTTEDATLTGAVR